MKTITRNLVATIAAGAVALSSAPVLAQPGPGGPGYGDRGHGDRGRGHGGRDHDRGGISAGEVIAGALVIGGIAAIASSSGRERDRGRYDDYYNRYGSPRSAVEQCVNLAESRASRASWRGRAKVTDIRSVRDTRYGYTIRGRIAVNGLNRDWRNGDNRYGRGWGNDYRGWNDNLRGYDAGNFTCRMSNGRADVSFSGIRGLR
ncbi:MAG: hypothetical protein P0Y56_03690 [Candidatus Andeanibacterium colombiense]|uniref:Uncharacterized protein n=1 Tax=Candidatus Andeanibacterium colombiense TaxID=3121345 RepID=A0AAJ5X442_9SPHN|nr:MAG: hypothetical protein P0Y56_03690 [Sphingomonadaceae bacterium]